MNLLSHGDHADHDLMQVLGCGRVGDLRDRQLLRGLDDARLTDGQLLGQFIATQDQAAFEALVRRHGKMVFSVCRRLLGNAHDAEDAFQATFLVLVRKAASISPREAVGDWLYWVDHGYEL